MSLVDFVKILLSFAIALLFFGQITKGARCSGKLGMQSKRIPDESITSSSQLSSNHAPAFARLDGPRAWCSAPGDNSPYIQILLDEEKFITAIKTQGSSHDFSWSRKYDVRYLKEGKWTSYKEDLTSNRNSRSWHRTIFEPPIRTRSIRIYPKDPLTVTTDETVPVVPCLRLELYGCSAPASCRVLQAPSNGKIHNNDIKHGAIVYFACNDGFQLKGFRQITCVEGKWNGNTPTCEVVQCGDPGNLTNGKQVVKKGYVYGGSVTFVCDKDYTLEGKDTAYCQADKSWSAAVPRCLAPCSDPGDPYQGNRIGQDFRHDHTVRFTCPRDYIMEGVSAIKCTDGRWSNNKPRCKVCSDPLGMENKDIPDARITASSEYNAGHGASNGRLNFKAGGGKTGAWSAAKNDGNQWLQVDLGQSTKVTGIKTQGRQESDQWVTSYTVSYSNDGTIFTSYRQNTVLQGNKDRNTVVLHVLSAPINARYIRLHPKTYHGYTSMRMELLGCPSV